VAFLRFSRDRRGYEHFQLVEPMTRRGKTRTRVLYWFRTPPGVRVGRDPFDEETRRALEAQYPSIAFDWRKIIETPIPPADTEKWRERRREEKAARRAKKAREATVPDRPDASEFPDLPDLQDVSDFPEPPDPSDQ
jgi:hypothetical protein